MCDRVVQDIQMKIPKESTIFRHLLSKGHFNNSRNRTLESEVIHFYFKIGTTTILFVNKA